MKHIITENQKNAFAAMLGVCDPQDEIVYHIGPYCGGWHKLDAMAAYDAGKCVLYQRRIGDGVFEYVAKKKGMRRETVARR